MDDQVCGQDVDGAGSCFPLTSISGPDLTPCKCSGPYPSFMADPYDPAMYMLCLSDTNTLSLSCPEGQVFNVQDSVCQAPPPTTTQRPIECTEVSYVIFCLLLKKMSEETKKE